MFGDKLMQKMTDKAVQLSEKLKDKWRDQISYYIKEQEKKTGVRPSKLEVISKFKSDKARMDAVEMMGMTDYDVESLIGEVLAKV